MIENFIVSCWWHASIAAAQNSHALPIPGLIMASQASILAKSKIK